MTEIDIPVAQSVAVSSVNGALEAAEKIGYPVIMRAAFTLGGLGSGFANNPDEMRDLAAKSLSLSPQVLIERSMKGWKELEYEVVRDAADVSRTWAHPLRQIRTDSFVCRTRSFAATWKTLILSVHTLVILSSSPRRKLFRMMSITCSGVLLSRSLGISVSSASVTFSMHSTRHLVNTVSLRSTLGKSSSHTIPFCRGF